MWGTLCFLIFLFLLSLRLFICLCCCLFSFSQMGGSLFILSLSSFVSGCQWTSVFLFTVLTSSSAYISLCLPLTRSLLSVFLCPRRPKPSDHGPSLWCSGGRCHSEAVYPQSFRRRPRASAIFFVTSLRRWDIQHSVVIKQLTVSLWNTLALAVAFVLSPPFCCRRWHFQFSSPCHLDEGAAVIVYCACFVSFFLFFCFIFRAADRKVKNTSFH